MPPYVEFATIVSRRRRNMGLSDKVAADSDFVKRNAI